LFDYIEVFYNRGAAIRQQVGRVRQRSNERRLKRVTKPSTGSDQAQNREMDMSRLKCSAILALAVVFGIPAIVGGRLSAQSQSARVSVAGPRPLADAVLELQQRHRWVITYEDTYRDYQGDLIDVTMSVHKKYDPKKPKIWMNPQRALVFEYPLSDTANPQVVVTRLLEAYHAIDHGIYEYRLVADGTRLHIVPAASKNAQGDFISRRSRFDTRVTIPEAERSVAETVSLLVQAVNTASQTEIKVFVIPANLFSRTMVRIGAQNEIARNVLVRALEATNRKVSWQLLCMGGSDSKNCGLSFVVVE